MFTHTVLSLNPETTMAELMLFQRLGDAERHLQTAIREGRVLVEVVSSVQEHLAWGQGASAYRNNRL